MCLAQGHNVVMSVRLEPTSPWSRVKHSTTEPLHSLFQYRVKLLAVLPILVPRHSQLEHVMLEYTVSYNYFSIV